MAEPQFQLHKLYIKDATFSTPNAQKAFLSEWKPELKVEIDTQATKLPEDNTHEVVLKVNCTVKSGDVEAFEVEVEQAGIFEIHNLPEDQLELTLGTYCPNLLYPYLRETVSDLVMRGGFPQLSLAPINFEVLYQQQQGKPAAAKTKSDAKPKKAKAKSTKKKKA